ncbi:ABC transporter permease [Sphingobacterium hungaricum]|uniref:FtsX-like permease family protein n=1 Tax=Sphingobacterium hungaricum TaxID=2082723 RepID=A0A928V0L1_9SPHI|nr:ABC transporter permease [Sphingobacterium hungaricum]MBE8715563.1 hypothetical protein [Sphingobacterium hungaricum]
MIKNYIKIAWRNLFRSKTINAIHIIGLSIAIATSILLFLTASFELSFDNFHENRKSIAKIYLQNRPDGNLEYNNAFPTPFASALKNEIPSIDAVTRFYNGSILLRNGDKQFQVGAKYVDPDFLSIFSFPKVSGTDQALENLDAIVLDEPTAINLFGTSDVLGKSIEIENNGSWESKIITALLEKVPKNSSLTFTALVRFETKPNYKDNVDNWSNVDHSVFAKFKSPISDDETFTKSTKAFMDNYYKNEMEMLKRDGAQPDADGNYSSMHAMPLNELHLSDGKGGSALFPYILIVISVLILFIACSNFINLTFANSISRNKEIGTRKTLGATAWQLVGQLWTESVLICLIGLFFGIVVSVILIPQYNSIMNYALSFRDLLLPENLITVILVFAVISLIAGGLPAYQIAKPAIIETLKGKTGRKNNVLRNGLTVVQFSIAIGLIIATIIISAQLYYIANRPLGFDKSEVISIPIGKGIDPEQGLLRMRESLSSIPWVKSVSASDINLGMGSDGSMSNSVFGFDYEGKQISTSYMRIDYDYLETLGIKLIAGRDISREFPTDKVAVLINKKMAQQIGGEANAVGKTLSISEKESTVVGIIDDFNFKDLRQQVTPLTISANPDVFDVAYIFVRVSTQDLKESLSTIEGIWKKINPSATASPTYLDENTQKMYANDLRFARIIITGSVIAISIACLGLFALALLTINFRTKEIGIRKVLGSSVAGIVVLLSTGILKHLLISILIAIPVTYYFMKNWLQGFEFRIDMQWWMYALGIIFTFLIAFATVSYHSTKIARKNPVDSLRDE